MRIRINKTAVLDGTVGAFRNWHLSLSCDGCGSIEDLPITMLIKRHGAHHPMSDVLNKLVCRGRGCGRTPTDVAIFESSVPYRRIALVGPEVA
jgi:hypothetical protein